jgi:hypothetical protein
MADATYAKGDKVWIFYPTKATSIGAVIDLVHPGSQRFDVTIDHPGHELHGKTSCLSLASIWKKQEPGDKQ